MSRAGAATHVVDATMFWSETGGGVRRYLLAKHDWLSRQAGWRHTIAVPFAPSAAAVGPPASGRARLGGLPLPGSGGYRLPLSRGAVARALCELRPDVIEAGDPYRVAWGALDAARALRVPAVAYCHSDIERMAALAGGRAFGGWAARATRRYARHLYDRFDLVLAPSASMRDRLHGWGVERAVCQPLGVDCTAFHPARADDAWRRSLGFAPQTRLLVYAGRFAVEKHLDVVAEAVRRLGAPYALAAIGDGPVPPPAGEQVRVLPFLRGTSQIAAALASADAFVHAGDQETFGLSLLEALACGTPAVVRAAGGLAEILDPRAGVAVAAGTPAAFAEAIEALFARDPAGLSAAARQCAEACDWERVLPGLLAHYGRLLGREPAARETVVDGEAMASQLR